MPQWFSLEKQCKTRPFLAESLRSLQHHVKFYTKKLEGKKQNHRKISRKHIVSRVQIISKNNNHSVQKKGHTTIFLRELCSEGLVSNRKLIQFHKNKLPFFLIYFFKI